MEIAVFGAGMVGGTLGRRFAEVGHTVRFGVPSPESDKTRELVGSIDASASAATVAEAARGAELVVLATPWDATRDAVEAAGDLGGRIVVDCTNPLRQDAGGFSLAVGYTTSGAEEVATWAPGARVVKAFNQTGFANMGDPRFGSGRAVMFVCGDDPAARETVRALAEQIGFEALDAGPLSIARLLEPLAMLWIHLAFTTDLGRDFAFGLLRR
jgi:predicted dinucleotide-binding enzyme